MSVPLPNPDFAWDKYDSKVNPVNGHVECTYNTLTGSWSEPRFVKSPFLQVHGLAPGLNYGQQVFEGLLAHRTTDNKILIFRPTSHAARLIHSASVVSMPPVPENLFLDCVHMAVAKNAEFVPPHDFAGNMYIRPLQFGSSAQIGLDLPDEFTFCVFVQPHPPLHGHAPLTALVAEDFDRAATRGTGNSKVGGNYGPVLKWLREAKKSENGGWGVLLHLDSKTQSYVDEFSTAALIGIVDTKNDEAPTLVVAHSDAVINSITADSVAKIAQSFVWKVKKRLVKLDELSSFCEVFAVGTAATIRPCSLIYHKSTNREFKFVANGSYYTRLWSTLKKIQTGESEDTFQWCQELRYEEFKGEK
ncbi:Aminotransferase fpaps4 [Fusarium poae]|jgi:branched-chain amino acid aminotransferase|uniref:Aminotransferase n=1 Tax=Fusarium poae TaxID=36050 RepID=UPI001D054D0F|nr:Aminotransferase [Fusarium poae]KAG8664408.1 Aminotransferase [Fusarium poae]